MAKWGLDGRFRIRGSGAQLSRMDNAQGNVRFYKNSRTSSTTTKLNK
jgi:hypothetical protein